MTLSTAFGREGYLGIGKIKKSGASRRWQIIGFQQRYTTKCYETLQMLTKW